MLADGVRGPAQDDAGGMNTPTTAAVATRGLTKTFGGRPAVQDVGFDVQPGRVVALLGPNGAGKTTTTRMILGLAQPDSGDALIDGRPYRDLEHPGRVVGAVLDAGGLHPGRTGRDHLRIAAAQIGVDGARVDAVIDEVGLRAAAGRRISGYSLGMRQRVALAAALLGEPSVLVLDEPANGLDPAGMHWLRGYLRDFAAAGGAVLISTHVLSEVSLIADDVIVIALGQVAAAGDLPTLVAAHGGDLERFYLDLTATTSEVR